MDTIPGYRGLVCIYESANSRIYRCRREQDDLPVILKLLREDYPSAQELIRYRQEYKITKLLDGRLGIIQTLGMGEHGSTFYIVLEDFEADSLKNGADKRQFTLTEKLSLAIRMAASIGEVHAAKIIHKDINLANVVYNPDTDTLKLIDFGISTQLTRECPEIRSPNVLEGTLAYISPEQTGRMNRAIDYRTDFYSLGAALYQLFTGQLPFDVDDPMELVHCHLARSPQAPCELVPEIPEMASAIIMKLMAKAPEDRYQSTSGIQTDFHKCMQQFQKMGRVQTFALGQRDFSEQLLIPQKLYGREPELLQLLGAFDRVAAGSKELMLLAGASGIGKTALVQELFKPMTERRGYFVSGKFDQLKRDLPYRALSEAFRQLMRQLLTLSEDQLSQWRQTLGKAVGPNGKIVAELIPELERVIGTQPAVQEVGPQESQNRFNYVFQNFVQAVASPDHPLILFIDDLQWADSASLKLLKLIMTTADIQHLHLIAAFRDNEVTATHPWMLTVKEIGEAGCRIESVSLGPLDVHLVSDLLSDALRGEPDETKELARLVHGKTQGNPFFVAAFLHTLDRNGLLSLDRETGAWQWDLTQIRALGITDNVAELMVESLRRLDLQTQKILSLAACIGNRFELSTLAVVCERNPKQTLALLQPALAEGFVLPQGQEYKAIEHDVLLTTRSTAVGFKLVHDRVQQAAYSLISEDRRKPVHWKIGKLLQKAGGAAIDIANHLNYSAADLSDPTEKDELTRLNLQAGKRAMAAAAYAQAANFLDTARSLIGQDGWEDKRELACQLCEGAAEAAYLIGDYPRAQELASEMECHSNGALESLNACKLKILCHMALHQPVVALDTGLAYLESLGFRLQRDPGTLRVGWELLQLKLRLSRTDILALADLPEMRFPIKNAAVMMMQLLSSAALFCRPKLFALLACQGSKLVIRYGLSPDFSFLPLGIIITSTLGDPITGYDLGELAFRLAERMANRKMVCRTSFGFNTFVKHWRAHLRETTHALREAVQQGVDSGNFEYAAYAAQAYCFHKLLLGEELHALEPEMASYHVLTARLGQNIPLAFVQIWHHCALQLLGRMGEPYRLLGAVMDEQTFLTHLEKSEQRVGVAAFHFSKLWLTVMLLNGQEASRSAWLCENYLESIRGIFSFGRFHFLASLAFLEVIPQQSKKERLRLLKKVRRNQKRLQGWARHAPMNHLHAYCLVEAERYRAQRKPRHAIGFYQRSIELAHAHGWVHEEGLANELAGRFYLEQKDEEKAVSHLLAARLCYLKWGAKAKVDQLDDVYGALLAKQRKETTALSEKAVNSRFNTTITTTSSVSASLDLGSILKASQTISGAIEFSKLLETLMRIIQENAGAERVVLVLKSGEEFVVEGVVEGAESNVYRPLGVALDRSVELSIAMVRFSIRSQESLVLGDAAMQGEYTRDSYVIQKKPRSVLCCPILRDKSLIGVLYLENNQTAEAFTPDRVELLKLLASQAAISLENARLVRELQTALEQARESARIKNEFLAKTSHELRTPLNALINIPEGVRENFVHIPAWKCKSCQQCFEIEEEDLVAPSLHCPSCQSSGSLTRVSICAFEGEAEETAQLLDRATQSGRHLLRMIDNILDISELENKKTSLTIEEVPVTGLVARVEEIVRPVAERNGVQLVISEIPEELVLHGDFLKLGQVLYNLIDNAIKFSPEGGQIDLEVDSRGSDVCFVVKDQGIGIARGDRERIFEAFRQVDEGTNRRFGGAGLGLSIAKNLVELHEGRIWVESELGQGSTFYVALPRADKAEKLAVIEPPE